MAQGVTYDGIPLMITNVGDENSVITLIPYGSFNARIYYKKDDDKFYKKWNYNAITLQPNSTLSLFGDSDVFSSSSSNYANFSIAGSSIKLSGRLASISHTSGVTYTYYKLFQNCTSVVEVSSDFLEGVSIPTTGYNGISILSYLFSNTGITQVPEGLFDFRQPINSIYACLNVYAYMFKDCKSLVSVPQNIFAKETFICQKQYQDMFSGCSSLTQAPDIYATNAPWLACAGMFSGCVSLENPPQIVFNGYAGTQSFSDMFLGCISLKQSPTMNDLIKDGLESMQHSGMFKDCSSLNHVEVSFTQWEIYSSSNNQMYKHTKEWLANVSPTGTFTCPKELAEATDGYYDEEGNFVEGVGRGVDTVPAGWYIDYPIIDARDGDANAMALLTALVEYGLCPRGEYLMNSEADAIVSINSVFANNTQITDFTAFQFFNGIKSLGAGTEATSPFANSTLTRIVLPDNINIINNYAFYNCSSLAYIVIKSNTPPTLYSSAIPTQTIIYVPNESVEAYKEADVWNTIANRIKPINELPQ